MGGGGFAWAKDKKLVNENKVEAKIMLAFIFIPGSKSMKKSKLSKHFSLKIIFEMHKSSINYTISVLLFFLYLPENSTVITVN